MKVENKKKAIRIIISIKPEKNLSTTNLQAINATTTPETTERSKLSNKVRPMCSGQFKFQ